MADSHTVVVGGGVVGVCSAYYLARRGRRVTLLETETIDDGASTGNAGIVAIGHLPLPRPGLAFKAVKWMLDKGSPLYIPPRFDLALLHWLWSFHRACNWDQVNHCMDMLADREERERLAAGDKVYWLTPGWLRHWNTIFKEWDAAKANETFPQHDRAVVLDGIGFFEEFAAAEPERLLAISDWMRLPIEAAPVSLDRLRNLLTEAAARSGGSG